MSAFLKGLLLLEATVELALLIYIMTGINGRNNCTCMSSTADVGASRGDRSCKRRHGLRQRGSYSVAMGSSGLVSNEMVKHTLFNILQGNTLSIRRNHPLFGNL